MTQPEARYAVLNLRRRLGDINAMVQRDPSLVRVATGDGGDQVVFWYVNGGEVNYNVSAAQRQIAALQQQFGPDLLRSRSGKVAQEVKMELPVAR